jgi:hypothetical protein
MVKVEAEHSEVTECVVIRASTDHEAPEQMVLATALYWCEI